MKGLLTEPWLLVPTAFSEWEAGFPPPTVIYSEERYS